MQPKSSVSNQNKFRFQAWVLASGIVLMTLKFVAWSVTGSNAILSDALESIVNVVAGGFALYAVWLSGVPKDRTHPYGHGKVEFISGSVEGSLILAAGFAIIFKSVYNLFYPQPVEHLEFGIYVSIFTGAVNYFLGKLGEKKGRQFNSMAMVADGKHLQSDAWSTLGLVIGLVIIKFSGLVWMDSLVAIVFGLYIGWTGWHVVRESVLGLMDAADFQLIQKMLAFLNDHRKNRWIDIHNLRVIKYGASLHLDCHITLPYYLELTDAHAEVTALEEVVKNNFELVEIFVHADPCIPGPSCPICPVEECPVRQAAFQKRIEWDLENITDNRKHSL